DVVELGPIRLQRPAFKDRPFALEDLSGLAHVHNFELQAALDLGIPGALAIGWLLAALFWSLWRACRHTHDAALRWSAAGLAGGMAAFLVFGISDDVAIGARGGLGFWLLLGLGAAVTVARGEDPMGRRRRPDDRPNRLGQVATALALVVAAAPAV